MVVASDPERRRTVIFDFDGTLADTLWLGLRVCNAIAPELGLRTVADEEVEKLREMSTQELLGYLGIPLPKLPLLVRRVRREMRRQIASVDLFEGIGECLQRLQAAGISLGVVTSNSRQNVRACLRNHGVDSCFDFVHTSTHLFGKHRTLRRLLRKRQLAAEGVYYVGDQGRDVEAARKCRVKSIAACWGYQSRERLRSCTPDFLAETPAEIEMIVLGHRSASPP